MKRLAILLVIAAFIALSFLAFSNRARTSQAEPCGCNVACLGGKTCAINCPTGKAAHCECSGASQYNPAEAKCYCR